MASFRKIMIRFFVALMIWAISMPAPTVAATNVKDIVAQAEAIQNQNPDFKLEIWQDRSDGRYKPGELVTFSFKANKDCYINIIDIGTSGKVRIIYPNQWHKSNRIEKGKTYKLPQENSKFSFQVALPSGENYVKAIATLDKQEILKPGSLDTQGAFAEVKDPGMAIRDIGVTLDKIGGKKWAEADTKIIIEAPAKQEAVATSESLKPSTDEKPLMPEKSVAPAQTSAKTAKDIVEVASAIENANKDFGLKLSIVNDKTSFAVGEEIRFTFSAERDCYVTLLDIGTSGKVHKLFPNKWHESNKVEKGKSYAIPPDGADFVFKVHGPAGKEYVKAIATLKPVEKLEGAVAISKGAFSEIRDAGMVLKDIGMELAQQDTKTWAETTISFDITDVKTSSEKPMSLKLWSEKKVYSAGEKIVFFFESDRDCNLTLIDIGSSGKVHMIFPNKYQTDNAVKANTKYEIPKGTNPEFVYTVLSPAGQDTIKAICTTKSASAISTATSYDREDFPLLGVRDEVLKDIAVQLNKLEQQSYAQMDYTIEIR